MPEQIPLRAWVKRNKIYATAYWAAATPEESGDKWLSTATHWRVKLTRYALPGKPEAQRSHSLTIRYHTGAAITADPTAADVLNSLAVDASSIDNALDFDDWCADFGYDTDSRKAERLYKACQVERDKLAAFLTVEQYRQLVTDGEVEQL